MTPPSPSRNPVLRLVGVALLVLSALRFARLAFLVLAPSATASAGVLEIPAFTFVLIALEGIVGLLGLAAGGGLLRGGRWARSLAVVWLATAPLSLVDGPLLLGPQLLDLPMLVAAGAVALLLAGLLLRPRTARSLRGEALRGGAWWNHRLAVALLVLRAAFVPLFVLGFKIWLTGRHELPPAPAVETVDLSAYAETSANLERADAFGGSLLLPRDVAVSFVSTSSTRPSAWFLPADEESPGVRLLMLFGTATGQMGWGVGEVLGFEDPLAFEEAVRTATWSPALLTLRVALDTALDSRPLRLLRFEHDGVRGLVRIGETEEGRFYAIAAYSGQPNGPSLGVEMNVAGDYDGDALRIAASIELGSQNAAAAGRVAQRGRRRLAGGELNAAALDLLQASMLAPDEPQHRVGLARALLAVAESAENAGGDTPRYAAIARKTADRLLDKVLLRHPDLPAARALEEALTP